MPLVAAAVCPHPPLLVPEVASGAAPELDDLRAACDDAIYVLRRAEPDLLTIVGPDPSGGALPRGARGTFGGFGVPLEVTLGGAGAGRREHMPLSVTVGAWLLGVSGYDGNVMGLGIEPSRAVETRIVLGRQVAARADRVALLVMGDGTACRTPKAPGAFDERAEPFDRAVSDALRTADVGALLTLDTALADELMVAGWPAWQVLAGAAGMRTWRGEVTYDAAPYGVGYFVATWLPA